MQMFIHKYVSISHYWQYICDNLVATFKFGPAILHFPGYTNHVKSSEDLLVLLSVIIGSKAFSSRTNEGY